MKKIVFLLFAFLIVTGCSLAGGEKIQLKAEASKDLSFAPDVMLSKSVAPASEAAPESDSIEERKLIKQGYIDVEVKELDKAVDAVDKAIAGLGGYVSSIERHEDQVYLEVRVPAKAFDSLFKKVGGLGRVISSNQNVTDITDSYYDLDTRLKNAYALEEKYRQYLNQAKSIEDILKVEQYLSNVRSDIERMEAQKRRYDRDVSYSLLRITLRLPPEKASTAYPVFSDYLSGLWLDVVQFFISFIFVVLRIVIFGVPILAALLFFYWLLWGKVGVLRKLLRLLSADKK